MQIAELYTFKPVLGPEGENTGVLESRLTILVDGRHVSAADQITAEAHRLARDKQGLYGVTLRELRRSIEKELSRMAFAPLS